MRCSIQCICQLYIGMYLGEILLNRYFQTIPFLSAVTSFVYWWIHRVQGEYAMLAHWCTVLASALVIWLFLPLYSIWLLNCQLKFLFGIYMALLNYSSKFLRHLQRWVSYMKKCFLKDLFACIYYRAIDYSSRAYKYPNISWWSGPNLLFY